jgi:phenylacetate-CoA ligase
MIEGRDFSPFYEEFKRNEFLSIEELQSLQFSKLKKLIEHVYETVPYYKNKFSSVGLIPDDIERLDDIKKLPLLSKNDLKENFEALVSKSYERSNLIEYATGGSTGNPTKFLLTREQYDSRAAVSFKAYQMTGWDFLKKTVFLSGAPIESKLSYRFKSRLKSFLMRQVTFPTFDLTESKLHDIYLYIQRKRPEVIFGYVSALLIFAQYLEANKLKVSIPIIIQMAEMIYPHQIEYIESFVGGKFFKHYGARDAIAMGIECEQRSGCHANMDTLLVEILRDNKEAYDEVGEVVVTDLFSYGMPLIRYQIDDVGCWKKFTCRCGRNTPLFDITEGRKTNTISTRNGSIMTGLFIPHLFKELSSKIRKYQVYQPDLDNLIVKIVKKDDYLATDEEFLKEKLLEKLGNRLQIIFEYPSDIPSEASGKYQFVKSEVPVSFGND